MVLAQADDIGGWIENIYILLIVGAALLSPILKKLINMFGGQKGAEPPLMERKINERRAGPPAARPVPPRPMTRAGMPRPPSPPIRPPARPQPVRRPQPAPQGRALQVPVHKDLPSEQRAGPGRFEHQALPSEVAAQSRAQGRESNSLEITRAALPSQQKELDADQLVSEVEVVESAEPSTSFSGWLDPRELRRAIILSEIISPPLALRNGEEGF